MHKLADEGRFAEIIMCAWVVISSRRKNVGLANITHCIHTLSEATQSDNLCGAV